MKEIKLTRGKVTIVDDEDYERLNQFKWYCVSVMNVKFYAARAIYINGKQKKIFMHREILNIDNMIDHKDRDGLNNQKSNLRPCNSSQNNMNKAPSGTSKYLGVSLHKKSKRWVARIMNTHLGLFDNEIDAAKKYDEAAKKHHGEFANLNFK